MVWDGIVACDLFCAGLGAWTYFFTVFATGSDERARKTKLVGILVGIVAVALGALILAVDAKGGFIHPLRYLHLLGNFGSVMTWGVVLISLFLVGAFVCALLLILKKKTPRALELVTALLGVGVSIYTGVLLGTSPAFPLWNLAVLPVAFLISAAYTGYAAYGLVARFTAPKDGLALTAPCWVGKAGLALPVLEAVALVVLLAVVSASSGSGAAAAALSVANLMMGNNALVFWGGVVVIGLAVPLVLAVLRLRQGEKTPAWMGIVEWVCIIIGGFAFRYAIVMAAVPMFA